MTETFPMLGEIARGQTRRVQPAMSRRIQRKREKAYVRNLAQDYL